MNNLYDIIIIGAGPAGMSAALYAGRAGYKTLIIEQISTGGQMMVTSVIDNYPGFPDGVSGFELQEKMLDQVKKFDVEIKLDKVKGINKKNDCFSIETQSSKYNTSAIIIATGTTHRKLDIPGEKKFASRGVSYCGTCDGPFFREKDVIVIGGGDTALSEAMFLSKFAKKVSIIHRRDRFRAIFSLVKQAKDNSKINFIFNSIPLEIIGQDVVSSIKLKNVKTNTVSEIKTDGVFVFVGLNPNSDFIDSSILDDYKYIITNNKMRTNIKGIFAAGDIRSDTFRQIICAASDGAKAGKYAGEYIDDLKGELYQ